MRNQFLFARHFPRVIQIFPGETALYRHNRKYLVAFIILRKLCRALVIEKGREGNINGATLRTLIVPGCRAECEIYFYVNHDR